MIKYIHMTAWQAWYPRHKVTHAKPIHTIKGSMRYLSGYVKITRNSSTKEIIKGK
jgi:hypothetical protein